MRLAIALAAAGFAASAVAAPISSTRIINPTAGSPASCPPISRYDALLKGGKAIPQRLGDLPAADHYKAVYRRVGDCVVPLISSFGLGLPSKVRR